MMRYGAVVLMVLTSCAPPSDSVDEHYRLSAYGNLTCWFHPNDPGMSTDVEDEIVTVTCEWYCIGVDGEAMDVKLQWTTNRNDRESGWEKSNEELEPSDCSRSEGRGVGGIEKKADPNKVAPQATEDTGRCTEPPDVYRGEELGGCTGGAFDDLRCCNYGGFEAGQCYYIICRDTCMGSYTEDTFQCQ